MSEALDFTDIEPVEIPVRIKDSNGVVQHYILYDASGHAEIQFRNRQQKNVRIDQATGRRVPVDVNDAIPVLIANCMTTTIINKEKQRVSSGQLLDEQTVRGWPTKVVDKLYEKILDISGMREETLEELVELKKNIDERIAKLKAGDQLKNSSIGTGKPSTCAENSSSPSAPVNGCANEVTEAPPASSIESDTVKSESGSALSTT